MFINALRNMLRRNPGSYLKQLTGIVHVGANLGQERDCYAKHGLRVMWVEPIPEVFAQLKLNIAGFPGQRAFQELLLDREDVVLDFHIANNDGGSSSIFDFHLHRDIWPDVDYVRTIQVRGTTLAALVRKENINIAEYDGLVLDTQGSELLVLKGAQSILSHFKYIATEVADFDSYKGCCQLKDLEDFLRNHGFREYCRHRFAQREAGGSYFDVVYRRIA